MKIVSWNINSIKARLEHVKRYLRESEPDILLLQELKGVEFPHEEFEKAGYLSHAVTQKAYNGVAVIAKYPVKVISENLAGDSSDDQARYLEVEINNIRVINIYLPNGNPAPGSKYDYKLKWMKRLKDHAAKHISNDQAFIIGGDFNVIPEAIDCHDPVAWKDDALFRIDIRRAFHAIKNLGLYDGFRIFDTRENQYTFWDYQGGAWRKNNGIRIDHFLLSPTMVDSAVTCSINKEPRSWDRPSDHTPIELVINPKG